MSRIEEAMRRAAQERVPGLTAVPPDMATAVAEDAAALPREPFLVEMSEHRRARSATATVATAAAPVLPVSPAAPPPAPAAPRSVFERIDMRLAEKVIVDPNMMPVSREQYRRLAAVLHDAQAERGIKVILVASAVAGEGKTLTSANLALTLSESYHRNVLLIDGDLRRPAVHEVFRISSPLGLGDALTARDDVKLTLHQVSSHLSVLPAGRPQADPMAGLTSERMRRIVEEAKDAFDWVIIDTPPLVLLPDAPLLAATADGVVLVVRAEKTPHNLVKRAVDLLGNAAVLGVVLNGASVPVNGSDRYYDSYYGARPGGHGA